MNVFPFCVFLIKFCFLFCFLHLVTVQKVHYLAVFLYALGFYAKINEFHMWVLCVYAVN